MPCKLKLNLLLLTNYLCNITTALNMEIIYIYRNNNSKSLYWAVVKTECFISQIENHIGFSVIRSGLNHGLDKGCGVPCECCCSSRVLYNERYSVTQSEFTTLVGPDLKVETNCKCLDTQIYQPETKDKFAIKQSPQLNQPIMLSSDDRETPFAHARRNKQVNGKLLDCTERTCYNGGKCLPSSPGFKWVRLENEKEID